MFGVLDGHGGATCSRFVLERLPLVLAQHLCTMDDVPRALEAAFCDVDTEFCSHKREDASGTTAVVAVINLLTRRMWVANAGDSRAVLFRGGVASALSTDHKASRADEKERVRQAGGFVFHNRVMGELSVSRAIGDPDFKEHNDKLVIARPDIMVCDVDPTEKNDAMLLLACDGLYDVVDNQDALRFLRERVNVGATLLTSPELDALAKDIVSHAITTLNSRDNVSVVLVSFDTPLRKTINDGVEAITDGPAVSDANVMEVEQ